jgi:hypothetical protein
LPLTQSEPAPQKVPHAPQFAGSTASSTHEAPHWVVPPPHDVVHVPWEQSCPAPHTRPHPPQFWLSRSTVVHAPLHSTCPPKQTVASVAVPASSSEHAVAT